MRLRDRFKKLTFWNKIGFIGAVASIVAIPLAFALFFLTPSTQDESGQQGRNVNSPPAAEKPPNPAVSPLETVQSDTAKGPGRSQAGHPVQEQNKPAMPSKASPPSINQTMIDSPGGIQAGGDVIVNQEPPQRKLTPEQRAKLLSLLHSMPRPPIKILSMMGDTESMNFASELASVFRSAGWSVTGPNQAMLAGNPKGLLIVVHSQDKAPAGAGDLQAALENTGFKAEGEANSGYPENSLALIVGHKP